jgi:hypothetical protein
MCESCATDFYSLNGNCEPCSTNKIWLWFVFPALIGLAFALYRLFNYLYSNYLDMTAGDSANVSNFYRAVLTLASVLTLFT